MPSPSTNLFQVARFLRLQPWFAALDAQRQDQVIRHSFTLHARRGEVVLRAGDPPQGWYALLSGFVKLQSPALNEQMAALLALTGGEWFGEDAVMQRQPRRYEVVALRDSELLCLPRAQFDELLCTNPAFNRAVLGHLNHRLGQMVSIIESQRTGTLEQRLALHLSRAFWHGLRKLNLCQEELGSLAGMSRQTANRGLKELERRGLVTLRFGRVEAVDQGALDVFVGVQGDISAARETRVA
ncbi:MAG TPA: Crp/Fnr family transcriptional regulator [Ramlibacter sp.]|nr:Crp/Fnr family transcriptional regulator [Ramlibacter sp.]